MDALKVEDKAEISEVEGEGRVSAPSTREELLSAVVEQEVCFLG
jgi:hypothetical protein